METALKFKALNTRTCTWTYLRKRNTQGEEITATEKNIFSHENVHVHSKVTTFIQTRVFPRLWLTKVSHILRVFLDTLASHDSQLL